MKFYLAFNFIASTKSFVIYVLHADTEAEASKYTVKIWMEEVNKENPIRVNYIQKVVSIEEDFKLDGHLPPSKFLVINFDDLAKFFVYNKNDYDEDHKDENGKFTIGLPLQIDEVFKEEN